MKKALYLISIFSFILCLDGCEKVNESELNLNSSSFTIEKAEALFGTEWSGTMNLKSGNTENARLGIKPDWCNGFTSQNDMVEVVEVGLWMQGSFSMADEASYKEWKTTKNKKMTRSLTRMVFLKHKTDGKIDQFLMTIVGDKPYHLSNKGRLENNTYLSKEKHFSGYIYYHDLNGKFVNGWMFEKGEPVGAAYQNSGEALNTQIKMATTCITVTTYTLYVICTDWYDDSNRNGIYDEGTDQWTNTTCGAPYEVESNIVYCPSFFTGDNSFSSTRLAPYGGTNGGYDPTVPPALPQCDCLNVCPVCHKCKDALILKSASTACTPAPVCTCPALPIVDASGLLSNAKANCIYQKLIRQGILSSFISRYFGPTQPSQSYLGELNLTWKLDALENNGITIPINGTGNSSYFSVVIILNSTTMNLRSSTEIAMTMLHEALHAKLLGEFYDITGSTDFNPLLKYYSGFGINENINTIQQMEMLNSYSQEMASALKSFDESLGISQPLSFYTEALKYQLSKDIWGITKYPAGKSSYDLLSASSKNCN